MKELIYLGCPYSHPYQYVQNERFEKVTQKAAELVKAGEHVYSPITHSHPIAQAGALPANWEYWEKYDRIFLSMSKKMIVLRLDGWEHSIGLRKEIEIAKEMGLPIEYCDEI